MAMRQFPAPMIFGLHALLHPVQDPLLQRIPLRRRDAKVHAQARVRNDHVVEDVVAVTDPGNRQAVQRGEKPAVREERLEQRHEVGQDLGGVVERRERIDDGHGRVLCEQLWTSQASVKFRFTEDELAHLDFGVIPHPGHDPIYHARHDNGGIVQALVDAELDVRLAQEHRMSTQESSGALGSHPSTGRPFGEDERDRLVLERLLHRSRWGSDVRRRRNAVLFEVLFVVDGRRDERLDLRYREVCERQEVRRGRPGGWSRERQPSSWGGAEGAAADRLRSSCAPESWTQAGSEHIGCLSCPSAREWDTLVEVRVEAEARQKDEPFDSNNASKSQSQNLRSNRFIRSLPFDFSQPAG